MAWSDAQQARLDEIRQMSTADLVHLMISEHVTVLAGCEDAPYIQNSDYFRAHEELETRFKNFDEWRRANG